MGFEKIDFAAKNTVGFKAVGRIQESDYIKVLFPLFEEARESGEKLNMLIVFGPEFDGYTMNAMWEDSKFGLRYMRTIEKCAVVTDLVWMRRLALFFGSMIPMRVKVFNNGQFETAKAWLEFGKPGLFHSLDEATGVLTVEIFSALSAEDFATMTDTVDSFIERKGKLNGIVIKTEKFPGWENFKGLLSHFEFVMDHHKQVKRVAMVADGVLAKNIPSLANHFVKAQVKHFAPEQLEEAQAWAAAAASAEKPTGARASGESKDWEGSQRGELQ